MSEEHVSQSRAAWGLLMLRILVGWVFLSEGSTRNSYSLPLWAQGRFVKLGIPAPQLMGPFVGVVEIACGVLLLLGLFATLATLPLSDSDPSSDCNDQAAPVDAAGFLGCDA